MNKMLILIVTFNPSKWIYDLIKSIYLEEINSKILIIDNASTDGSVELIEKRYSNIVLIKETRNLGFGRANNIGFKYAIENDFKFVFLLNQDTIIMKNTLSQLLESAAKLDNFGYLSPIQLNWKGDSLESVFEFFLNKFYKNKVLSNLFIKNSQYIEIEFANAASWLVSVDVIKKVGGFNPIFPHYCEDIDFSNRLKFFGFKNFLVSNAFIKHYSSEGNHSILSFKDSVHRESYERVVWLCDPNKSFKFAFREIFLLSLNNFVINLFPFSLYKLKQEFCICIKIIKLLPKIKKFREMGFNEFAFL